MQNTKQNSVTEAILWLYHGSLFVNTVINIRSLLCASLFSHCQSYSDTIKHEHCTAILLSVKSYTFTMPSIYARQPAFIAALFCHQLLVFESRKGSVLYYCFKITIFAQRPARSIADRVNFMSSSQFIAALSYICNQYFRCVFRLSNSK